MLKRKYGFLILKSDQIVGCCQVFRAPSVPFDFSFITSVSILICVLLRWNIIEILEKCFLRNFFFLKNLEIWHRNDKDIIFDEKIKTFFLISSIHLQTLPDISSWLKIKLSDLWNRLHYVHVRSEPHSLENQRSDNLHLKCTLDNQSFGQRLALCRISNFLLRSSASVSFSLLCRLFFSPAKAKIFENKTKKKEQKPGARKIRNDKGNNIY